MMCGLSEVRSRAEWIATFAISQYCGNAGPRSLSAMIHCTTEPIGVRLTGNERIRRGPIEVSVLGAAQNSVPHSEERPLDGQEQDGANSQGSEERCEVGQWCSEIETACAPTFT